MLTYPSRAPRLDLSLPLQFTSREGVFAGHCLNVSASGLRAIFDRPLDLWTDGSLLLHYGDDQIVIEARVARVEENEAGLAFLLHDECEREAIRTMLAFAAAGLHLTSRPPF